MSENVEPSGEQQEVVYSDVEQAAIDRGWKPKEEYSGDPTRWRSAEVFMALDEPLKRIEHQSKEVKQLRAAIEASKEHYSKVEAAAFDRALKSLKEDRKQAMIDGDTEKVFALEEEADAIKVQKAQAELQARKPVVEDAPQINPEFTEWRNRNSWYQSDKAMTAVADVYGRELHDEGHTPAQVLRMVAEKIKEDFPQKFNKGSKNQAVEPSSRGGRSSGGNESLSQTEVDIMRKIVKSGVMTEAQYRADLKKLKES